MSTENQPDRLDNLPSPVTEPYPMGSKIPAQANPYAEFVQGQPYVSIATREN